MEIKSDPNPVSFGVPIHVRTRAQAIADGVQVDVTETATEVGIRFPMFLKHLHTPQTSTRTLPRNELSQSNPIYMNAQSKPTTPETNRPVHTIRYGNISASIWQQQTERGTMYNVTFQRSYREGETWKSSSSFGQSNLLTVSLVATRAFEWIASRGQAETPEA